MGQTDRPGEVLRALESAGGLTVRQAAALPCFAGLAPDSARQAAWEVLAGLGRSGRADRPLWKGGPWTVPRPDGEGWRLEELYAYLCQLAEVAAGVKTAADLGALARTLDPGAAAKARDAARAALDERDRLRKGAADGGP